MMKVLRRFLTKMLPCLLLLGCATSGGDSAVSDAISWDGEVQVHGALRAMFHEGQTGSMVELDAMLPNPDLYAVGALADLSGEVTVIRGKAYLSYADGADKARTEAPSPTSAGATLLVAAIVPGWRSYTTESPIRFEDLDEEIAKLAAAAGMSLNERFPFLLRGHFEDLQWHVIDGRRLTGAGSSHQDHLAAATKMRLDRTSATLIGFYSQGDQGVFTHMGSTTHIHCVIDDPLSTGHVDHVTIPTGTTVEFPARRNERPNKATQRTSSAGG